VLLAIVDACLLVTDSLPKETDTVTQQLTERDAGVHLALPLVVMDHNVGRTAQHVSDRV
jgi:hypothetical protein